MKMPTKRDYLDCVKRMQTSNEKCSLKTSMYRVAKKRTETSCGTEHNVLLHP